MHTRKPCDNFPQIISAGKKNQNKKIAMKELLTTHKSNQTPDKLKKFRKTNLYEIGKTTLHSGNYEDIQNLDQNFVHGIKTIKDENLQQLLVNKENQGFQKKITEEKNQIYFTERMKGLGQTVNRNYQLPEEIKQDENFKYDEQCVPFEQSQEEILRGQNLYKKSHQDYQPGEQKKRDYQWQLDPNNHIFGKSTKQKFQTVENCLKEEIPVTKIKKQNLCLMKEMTQDKLGRSKTNRIDPKFEYVNRVVQDSVGVAECFKYQTAPGQKKQIKKQQYENDYTTIHGLTTEQMSLKSLNLKQKEDQISFFDLLNYNYKQQIKPENFTKKLPKKEIDKLIQMTDIKLSSTQIDQIWNQNQDDKMSVNEFLIACKKLGYAKQL